MPSSQGHSNQQRRTFRGLGGATDGRLPPKSTPRIRLKYRPSHNVDTADTASADIDPQPSIEHHDSPPSDDEAPKSTLELLHLQTRINNILTSIQTSRGLSGPAVWHTNCLLPTLNALREWRSILAFHLDSPMEPTLLEETARQAFGLVQLAVQCGPLGGSHPGYFKRCGGQVAAMALGFLNEVVNLTRVRGGDGCCEIVHDSLEGDGDDLGQVCGFDDSEIDHGGDSALEDGRSTSESFTNSHLDSPLEGPKDAMLDLMHTLETAHDDVIDDGDSASEDDRTSTLNSVSHLPAQLEYPNDSTNEMIQALQTTLHFTEKQSQRILQWIQNAQKAISANGAPSKSAMRVQSQKSKKLRMKELKMERRLKKSKKGGGAV